MSVRDYSKQCSEASKDREHDLGGGSGHWERIQRGGVYEQGGKVLEVILRC